MTLPLSAPNLIFAARREAKATKNSNLLKIVDAIENLEAIDEQTQNDQAMERTKDMVQVAKAIKDSKEGQLAVEGMVFEQENVSWEQMLRECVVTKSYTRVIETI